MFCHVSQRKFSDLAAAIDNAAVRQRLPYMAALELTYRCNQACRHCYCNLGVDDVRKADELTTKEVKRILDEAADAGCFWLLLTGGEVLVREDFWDIYMHAIKKGMLIELFTNATLIDGKSAARFAEYPPLGIDISIYGSTPALHDKVTRVDGSFKKAMAGMEWLKRYGVKFSLKTILMTLNYGDLAGIRVLAESLGAKFRYDTLLCPRTDGDMAPVTYRLSAEKMAACDLEDDYGSCEKIFDGFWGKLPEEAPSCGGGIFAFNINPYGALSPCTMYHSFQYPLKRKSFKREWKRLVDDYDTRYKDFLPGECRSCSMQLICANCPAWAEVEAGGLDKKIGYICEYAKCLEREYFKKKRGAEYGEKVISETGDQGSQAHH